MCFTFAHKIKIMFVLSVIVIVVAGIFAWQKYPFGVKRYKTITLGMQAVEGAGTHIGWAPPDNTVPEESDFYVYSLGDETMCIGSDCGIGGYFVECLGGWLSGYKDIGEVSDYGLRDAGVNINKQKIITIADKDAKIVGIYPGASIRNLPYIMRNHRDLIPEDRFKGCSDLLPRRWK
ncbi:MAG: hypothetical protein A3H70_00190 [Candidatus Komeilibacteria bacterium RIFCSPLOWO2_02_FULL_48_11]|uniref:Uncharacterized protein n=1 Tax=Candidatus Komeilibacteria bacterium RIFCSPLOWO2_02_FULL_48_11 TaxID=1798553 RepID=A0A1G2BSR7_9BACT|nr:MAG: hypothetical protein A3H70_00190 [Candidatus Komeilibacteria bacterium RIFCSPLOWO2_02_FULL_48_11]